MMTSSERVKYAIKILVSHALYYAGLLHLWQAIVMRRKAVVLMYHRVLSDGEREASGSHPALVVDRDTFARHMAVLKRRFVVLSAEEFADRLERKIPLPNSSCVITFDDGWKDNLSNALPALVEHGLPAVVFLPTNYIGCRRVFWQEALTHLLTRAVEDVRAHPDRRPRIERALSATGLEWVLTLTEAVLRPRILDAVATQKTLPRAAVAELLTSLSSELAVPLESLAATDGFMNWEDVAAMARGGVAFGGHGVEHLLLTQVPIDDAKEEIIASKVVLDRKLAKPAATFSYPNGYWNRDSPTW